MAFTKIVGAGIHTLSNVHTHNINSSGIITATSFVGPLDGTNGDFSGNVTIDGNLIVNGDTTTLNTTLREVEILRVDANNSTVGAAITQSGTGDILNLYDNTTEVFSVEDGGKVKIGMGALGTNTSDYDAAANNLIVGTGSGDEGITILSGQSVGHHGSIFFADGTGATNSKRGQIRYEQNSERMKFFTAGSQKLTIDINGQVGIGSAIPSEKLDVIGNIKLSTLPDTTTNSYLKIAIQDSDGVLKSDDTIKINPAQNALDVDGLNISSQVVRTNNTEELRLTTGAGNGTVDVKVNSNQITLLTKDNTTDAFSLKQGSNEYITVDTTNSSELITLGNTTTNPKTIILGGNVGIGTDNPQEDLHIGSNSPYILLDDYDNSRKWRVKGTAWFAIEDATAGVDRFRIFSDGRVGINTTAPQNSASVQNYTSTTRHQSFQSSDGDLAIVSDNNYNPVVFIKGIGNADLVNVFDNTTEVFTIKDGGNVGINETAPSEKLQIDGDILLGGQANASESNYAIKFEYNNHQFAKIVGDGRDSTGYGDIDFYTSTGSGASNLTQRMSIRADGKIGIGDFTSATPDSMLHINGISGTAQIRLQRINAAANTNDYGRIYFESTDNVLTGQISVARESAENNGYMLFKTATGGTLGERLRISSTGVVTVNTASLLDAFKIDYGGGFNLSIDGGGNIKHNRANGSNGGLELKTALTSGSWGTGGGYIALKPNGVTNGLHVDKDGRVMVLTTTPGVATGDEFTVATDEHTGITIRSGSSHEGNIFFGDGGAGAAGVIRYEHNNDAMVFKTNSTGQERLRIDSSGNVKVVARGSSTSGAPFYVAVTGKSSITYNGGNDDTACLRVVDNGSTNSYYHGIELRSRQGADVRLYCQDQGNDLSHFVIATDNSALLERARFTQYGLHLQPYTTDSANSGYPISTFTDGGTRFATHLATMSGYSGDGEIIVITQFGDHSSGSEMFSVRITGYWYSSNVGGAIDCVIGCYAGENSYYNPTVTGTYPVNWRDKIKFASITSGNNQGKMCIRLGAVGSANDCELAFTDCTHGFYGVNQSKTSGWRVIKVNDQNTINNTYNGTTTTAIHRSNEIYNDEFAVYGGGTGELLTTRPQKGGTILGTYQYTQYNQGLNYEHLIRSPYGHTDLTDSYCDSNWMALISASVDGTSTVDTGTTYFCQDNTDDNNSLSITNKFGYSGSGSSNRIYMVVNSGRVAWKMEHGGAYRISVTVQFLAGGKKNGTYNTADTAYQAN